MEREFKRVGFDKATFMKMMNGELDGCVVIRRNGDQEIVFKIEGDKLVTTHASDEIMLEIPANAGDFEHGDIVITKDKSVIAVFDKRSDFGSCFFSPCYKYLNSNVGMCINFNGIVENPDIRIATREEKDRFIYELMQCDTELCWEMLIKYFGDDPYVITMRKLRSKAKVNAKDCTFKKGDKVMVGDDDLIVKYHFEDHDTNEKDYRSEFYR